ncbi:AAA family ATPase [uncultured Desulfobacter sp.]|uniref:AAA family ATPase n=1 Tax=uncultured Desulfobacter sp. TaxID=240139 RepID=UPI0029C63492|nr:AAA family ATPase [uncultured Desulfobacter sp.]
MFTGLFLEKNWDWGKKYPVIHIDLAESVMKSPGRLDQRLHRILAMRAEQAGLTLTCSHVDDCFEELIHKLHAQEKHRVVVLVDEYDKPILDNITDTKTAMALRDGLRNFYSVLKAQGAHLRFVLLTGVSKFSKVSLFSGLNNLNDISLDKRYGTLCGYTQEELKAVFHQYLSGVDLNSLKAWYNGYCFLSEAVYNPFDILLYLDRKQFKPYWFESGTPTFLVHLIREKGVPAAFLEKIKITDTFMGSFDVDCIEPSPLLFQTGYLTIKETIPYPGGIYYKLGFPNHEVKYAFNDALLADLTRAGQEKDQTKLNMLDLLTLNDLDGLK